MFKNHYPFTGSEEHNETKFIDMCKTRTNKKRDIALFMDEGCYMVVNGTDFSVRALSSKLLYPHVPQHSSQHCLQ